MSHSPPQLNANPFALIRSLPTEMIPLNQLKALEGRATDEIFLSRYGAFLRGKVPIHETRMSIGRIRRGSMTARYTHTLDHGDEAVYHEDATQTMVHVADLLVAAIVSRVRDDVGSSPELFQ